MERVYLRAPLKGNVSAPARCFGVLLTFAGVGVVLAERGLTFTGKVLTCEMPYARDALCARCMGSWQNGLLIRYKALT